MENHHLRGLFGVSMPRAQVVRDESPPTENIYYEIPITERLHANPNAGDKIVHPDMHLLLINELCGLFKLAQLLRNGIIKKLFPLFLEGKTLAWFMLLDDSHS